MNNSLEFSTLSNENIWLKEDIFKEFKNLISI